MEGREEERVEDTEVQDGLTDVEDPSMDLGERIIPAKERRSVSKRELFSFLSCSKANGSQRSLTSS